MLFNSFIFLLFLPCVLITLRILEKRPLLQKLFLLAASNFFYGYWDYRFLALLWLSILIDFTAGLAIGRAASREKQRFFLSLSVISNLSILGFFKYFNFFQTSLEKVLEACHVSYDPDLLGIALPVGISFYTFQSMSYTIDVYRGEIKPCRNLINFAQYICFFPQLVAGPIERAKHLLPQLEGVKHIRLKNVLSGFILLTWGMFKKVVIADSIGAGILGRSTGQFESLAQLLIGLMAFSFRIYGDFSGYGDIARGTSRMMGLELVDNFRAPYWAADIRDFWRRWHISLSYWFRDYLYIPLGGDRLGKFKTFRNLVLTMFLCGLWHGAHIKFVVWGVYHGFLLLIERWWAFAWHASVQAQGTSMAGLKMFLKKIWCFILVSVGWFFFLGTNDMLFKAKSVLADPKLWLMPGDLFFQAMPPFLFSGFFVMIAHHFQEVFFKDGLEIEDLGISPWILGVFMGLLWCHIFLYGSLLSNVQFIYFQF